jgi:hypothetical protein
MNAVPIQGEQVNSSSKDPLSKLGAKTARIVRGVIDSPPTEAERWPVPTATELTVLYREERERLWVGLWASIAVEFASGSTRADGKAARKLSYAYAQALHDLGYQRFHTSGVSRRVWRWDDDDADAGMRKRDPKDWIENRDARWERRDEALAALLDGDRPDSPGWGSWQQWRQAEADRLRLVRWRLACGAIATNRLAKVAPVIASLSRLCAAHERAEPVASATRVTRG